VNLAILPNPPNDVIPTGYRIFLTQPPTRRTSENVGAQHLCPLFFNPHFRDERNKISLFRLDYSASEK
jgi:hypothetical protein